LFDGVLAAALPPERPAGAEEAVDPLLPDDPRGTARSPPEC
jgi:hypothetical protein